MKKYFKFKVFNLYGGAGAGAAPTTDDHNPFTCPVCFEQYNNKYKPITLLCGHSLCIICLTKLKTMKDNNPFLPPRECPTCRMRIADQILNRPNTSISLRDGSLYLQKIETDYDRELKAEKRKHDSTKQREERLRKQLEAKLAEKPSVNTDNTDNFKFFEAYKNIAAIAAEEEPKLRFPETETLKFKEEKRDMSKLYLGDAEYIKNKSFNDILAIKKFVNDNGLEEFQVGEYANTVTFDENGVMKRGNIRIEHINYHGGVDIHTGLPVYGIVHKTPDGTYTNYFGSSNFIQFRIREDNIKLRKEAAERGAARIDPEVYKFIQKIPPLESTRRAQAHKDANKKNDEKYAGDY